ELRAGRLALAVQVGADEGIVDLGDIGQVVVADAVAIRVAAVYPAVRQAVVAQVQRRDLRVVVAKELVLPGQRELEAARDVVGGNRSLVAIRVDAWHVLIAGERLRAAARIDLGRMAEGEAGV